MGGVRIVRTDEGAVLVAACGVQDVEETVEETVEAGLRWGAVAVSFRYELGACHELVWLNC